MLIDTDACHGIEGFLVVVSGEWWVLGVGMRMQG